MAHGWNFLCPEDKDSIFHEVLQSDALCKGPFHLEIDPVDRCNARCYFCTTTHMQKGDVLPFQRIEHLFEQSTRGGLRSVRLSGGGESLLHPQFTEVIDLIAAHHVHIDRVTTNGIALRGSIIEALSTVVPAYMEISLNFSNATRYAQSMGVSQKMFHQVCDNIVNYYTALREKGQRGKCEIHTQFFITRETLDDLPEMFELAERLRVTAMTIRGLNERPESERLTEDERRRLIRNLTPLAHEYKDRYWIMFSLEMEGLGKEAQELSNAIHAHHSETLSSAAPFDETQNYTFCLMPWYSLTVLGSGLVYPCCMLVSCPQLTPLGNINSQSVSEMWNGSAFARYRNEIRRSMLLDGPVPMWGRLCKHTAPLCWSGGACCLARDLADAEDFIRLKKHIQQLRSSVRGRATRFFYGTMRKGANALRRMRRQDR